ncbi:MAG: asparagine synthetase A [Candidatus Heimdallarchaeota archaeon]
MRSKVQPRLIGKTYSDNKEITLIYRIQSVALKAIHDYLDCNGLVQLMPVILAPITDPLNHPVHEAQIKTGIGQKLQLTRSMIFHKQIAIARLDVKGIYIMSPNIRLEIGHEKSDRHLFEFTQVDMELKNASAGDFMAFIDRMLVHVFSVVKLKCESELDFLGAELELPVTPLKIYWSKSLKRKFGSDWADIISRRERSPFWITDFEREFYDREDPEINGRYINYDLFWPYGYGEALSGGERDFEFFTLERKIRERNQNPREFEIYLDLARQGVLGPSVGGGLGVERLVRFLARCEHIQDITLFPRIPGKWVAI